jgi:hypothetical protein
MKIYLAAGFTVTNVKGRERELSERFEEWKRLFTFVYMKPIEMSEILIIKKDYHARKQIKVAASSGNRKTRVSK